MEDTLKSNLQVIILIVSCPGHLQMKGMLLVLHFSKKKVFLENYFLPCIVFTSKSYY